MRPITEATGSADTLPLRVEIGRPNFALAYDDDDDDNDDDVSTHDGGDGCEPSSLHGDAKEDETNSDAESDGGSGKSSAKRPAATIKAGLIHRLIFVMHGTPLLIACHTQRHWHCRNTLCIE